MSIIRDRLRQGWLALIGKLREEDAANAKAEADTLGKMLHEIDERLYLISQELDRDKIMKALSKLIEEVDGRRIKEHHRITAILIPQIEAKYGR